MNNWLTVIAFLFSVLALGLGVLNVTERPNPRPHVVVLDLPTIAKDGALALATSDLDDEELEQKTAAWVSNLSQRLNEIAKSHNLIILPRDIGIIGAPDITAGAVRELRADQGKQP